VFFVFFVVSSNRSHQKSRIKNQESKIGNHQSFLGLRRSLARSFSFKKRSIQTGLSDDGCQGTGLEVFVHRNGDATSGIALTQLQNPVTSSLANFHKALPLKQAA
jgi:hypothetical protein